MLVVGDREEAQGSIAKMHSQGGAAVGVRLQAASTGVGRIEAFDELVCDITMLEVKATSLIRACRTCNCYFQPGKRPE